MKPFYLGLGVVAVIGVAFVLWQTVGGSIGGNAATAPVPVAIDPAELARVEGISIGSADAPVVIYEFADFQCPGCADFATFTSPLIKERLVETGQVRFVYYDYPIPQLHPHAFLAARAARCANDQGRFWDYHDILYARQARWSAMSSATDYFVELAGELNLDEAAFEECLRSDRFQEEVSRSLQLGQMLGVQSTPSLFINQKRLDLQSIPTFSDLERLVQAELNGAPTATTPPETPAAPPAR